MPLGGGGTWDRTPGTRIANQGALVSAQVNDETDNLLAGINVKASLSGALAMTGLQTLFGAGTAALHGATVAQAQSQALSTAASVAGTVDAITVVMAPVTTAYVKGDTVRWTSSGANTVTAPTINRDSLGAKTIKKGNGSALAAGDIGASPYLNEVIYNGTDFILQNPLALAGSDPLKANLASPTFSGVPAAPTAAANTNTTQLATTAFVTTADNLKANLASPALTGTPTAPTAGGGTNTTQIATTAFVTTAVAGGGGGASGAAKFTATATAVGALSESFNLTSVTDTGSGRITFTIATDFSTATWTCVQNYNGIVLSALTDAASLYVNQGTKAAGTVDMQCRRGSDTSFTDPAQSWCVAGFGT